MNELHSSSQYIKCFKKFKPVKKESNLEKVVEKILSTFQFARGIKQAKCLYVANSHPNFEIWYLRIPGRGSGKSGGFRLLCVRDSASQVVILDYIQARSELEKQHNNQDYQDRLADLKIELENAIDISSLINYLC